MPLSEAAHHFFEALDYHDLEALAAIYSDDFQLTGNVTQPLNQDGQMALLKAYFTAFIRYFTRTTLSVCCASVKLKSKSEKAVK